MKKTKILLLSAALLLAVVLLSACGSFETTPDNVLKTDFYTLTFESNGDGTCYISDIKTNPDNTEDFTLELPDKSPLGDTVTDIRCTPLNHSRFPLFPAAYFEEHFGESMRQAMADEGKEWYYRTKFLAYFWLRDPAPFVDNERILSELYSEFPITAYVGAVYQFAFDATEDEYLSVLDYMTTFAEGGYSEKNTKEVYDLLKTLVKESEKETAEMPDGTVITKQDALDSISLDYNSRNITALVLPSQLTTLDFSWLTDKSGIKQITLSDGIKEIPANAFEGFSNLKHIEIPDSVTSIGNYAFQDCSCLTSITIPESVTSIGSSAFAGCGSLTDVHITNLASWCGISFNDDQSNPLSYYAKNLYLNGELITELIIPSGVTSIGNYAFYGCSNLTSITIPDSVMSIGSSAFVGCDSLTYSIYDNAKYLGNEQNPYLYLAAAISRDIITCNIHDQTKLIGSHAFANCLSFTEVTIPNSVTSIGDSAFANCLSFTEVTIPNSVTSIGNMAFSFCESLTSITIPDSVTSIGDSAFAGCSSLTEITVPAGVMSIGRLAFDLCDSLAYTVYDNAKYLGNEQNPYLYLATAISTDISTCHIHEQTKFIGDYAFFDCRSLTSITIPNSVTSIGDSAFLDCDSLTSVTIPDSVTNIGKNAFLRCSNLKNIAFTGTKEQWNAIDNKNSGIPGGCIVHCTDGDITME